MNDIDKLIRKIMIDDIFTPLRNKYIIDLKYHDSKSAVFELLTSNFKPNKHYIMKAEILYTAENLNSESAEILDYKILKINQRIRLNSDFNTNTDSMINYSMNDYSIKLFAMNDEYNRTIYYLIYMYDYIESLAQLVQNRNLSYSTEDAVKNAITVCKAVRQCHRVNICHNDITPENIFVSPDGEYKIGKIDMRSFVNFPDSSHPSRDLSITSELSVHNDIYMIGRVIKFIAGNASKKDKFLHGRLIRIAEKSCRKRGGYKNIDEVISDLHKASSKLTKIIVCLSATALIVMAGFGVFFFMHSSKDNMLGDINGDGVINQADVVELQSTYSSFATTKESFTDEELAKFDINSDGHIDVRDASALMSYIDYVRSNEDITVQKFIELQQNE